MDNFNEQVFEMIKRCKSQGSRAAAASVSAEPREWYYDKNGVIVSKPVESKTESKAASTTTTITTRKVSHSNKAKVIADFIAKGY